MKPDRNLILIQRDKKHLEIMFIPDKLCIRSKLLIIQFPDSATFTQKLHLPEVCPKR